MRCFFAKPTHAFACIVVSGSFAAQAAAAPIGIGATQLLAMAPTSITALVDQAKIDVPQAATPPSDAEAPAQAVQPSTRTNSRGISAEVLLASEEKSFATLIQESRTSRPAPAVKPQAPARESLTVAVTIAASPDVEPVAEVVKEPDAPQIIVKPAAPEQPVASEIDLASLLPSQQLSLEILEDASGLSFKPQSLVFEKPGISARIVLAGQGFEGLSIFVRDQSVVEFAQSSMELKAQRPGVTEVYAVMSGKMYIVPVTVAEGGDKWDLKVPGAMVSIDGVLPSSGAPVTSAQHRGLGESRAPNSGGLSLRDSLAETARTAKEARAEASRYTHEPENPSYTTVTIQVVDERSSPAAGRVYPVAGVNVRIIGTQFVARTDATGHLSIQDVPANGRFLVRVDDPAGVVRPTVGEIWAGQGGVTRLRVMRHFSFDAFADIAGVVQHAAYASYCATIVDRKTSGAPYAGIAVALDVAAEGPFYFNQYGFLDRSLRATGPDGRFCYFNISPGPMGLSLYQDSAYVATLPVSTFAGRHVDQEIGFDEVHRLDLRLAAMAAAHDQLGVDTVAANAYKSIDMIDLIPLGTDAPMMQLAPGHVGMADDILATGNRLLTFAQAAEFEPTIYSHNAGDQNAVVPLIPRGFVEDMAVYAQVVYDPVLGTVLAEYGHGEDVPDAVSMRLVDAEGHDVGEGWYFSDRPVTKALFFNVPSGTYALLVETRDKFWLGGATVIVYNESVSYIRQGGGVRYRP